MNPLPIYDPIPAHQRDLAPEELIMISFKWNVHNAHSAWMNPVTAAALGLSDGDWIDMHGLPRASRHTTTPS